MSLGEKKKLLPPFTSEIPTIIHAPSDPKEEYFLLLPLRRIHTGSVCAHWKNRINKRIYLLADGKHTEIDLTRLLHSSLFFIRRSLGMLFYSHAIDITIKEKDTYFPLEITLLKTTLDLIAPKEIDDAQLHEYYQKRKAEFAQIFSRKLSLLSEKVYALFSTLHCFSKEEDFFQFLWAFVESLEFCDPTLTQKILHIGNYHQEAGVQSWMYPLVGKALLATYEEFLGVHWTHSMQENWMATYDLLTGVLLSAKTEQE